MEKTKKDTRERELTLTRILNAPVELVWEVWTNPEHIAQWWGPDGFTTTIHKMEVKAGGEWDLVMHGPDGKNYKNRSIFHEVTPNRKIVYEHVTSPHFVTTVDFEPDGDKTQIRIHMLFESREQLIHTVKTFRADEGLRQNIEKLNIYVSARLSLHKQLKQHTMARTSTYLNFPGNTEEAFNFYRSVFETEFNGGGIRRFADIPPQEGQPPIPEADKKLVLHVELPITGGHVLMATDATESMGFTLTKGNNMHIMVEPETRKETKKLFDSLSAGGNVTMPLQDMFWGAFYGSCTDKFGINWMFNCTGK